MKRLLFYWMGWCVMAAAFGSDMRNAVVQKFEVELAGWPIGLDGFRVLLLADFHVRKCHIDTGALGTVVTKANALAPDLTLLLGDYVAGRTRYPELVDPEVICPVLGNLRARCGVFAILGNHDAWLGRQRVSRALRSTPIRLLRDEIVTVETPRGSFQLAGMDTPRRRNSPVKPLLLRGERRPELPCIFMVHDPARARLAPAEFNFIVAAHTHGGQVRLPLFGDLLGALYHPKYTGKNRHFAETGKRTLFITSGLGTSRLHLRLNCPPEIVELTLRSPARNRHPAAE